MFSSGVLSHLFVFKFCGLPFEVLDTILQKSYLHWILNSSANQRDEEVIRSLMSVNLCFYRRITRRRFKRSIWHYLKGWMSSKH